ncbi:hypothetical protein KIW84_072887 [Lathyrus oleraceus]|uniref:Uncharacterized protein n=1 Tax=Pisum sativum TaxID=3888 RepID=A0A9D4ZY44_PEA|nr:hypothetical protein KIW84_072887 [Pisum sativum]
MSPFSIRQYGPDCLRKPFPNPSRREENEIHDTLIYFFNHTTLWSRLTSAKTSLRVAPYQPNLVSRKFGLSQMLPKCLGEAFFFSAKNTTERWLKSYHEFCKRKEGFLYAFDYKLSYHCTQEFEEWWSIHRKNVLDHTLMEQCLVFLLIQGLRLLTLKAPVPQELKG